MRQHHRTMLVNDAELQIAKAVHEQVFDKNLTYIELLQILNRIKAGYLKYALREERHPDNIDKPGDIE